MFRKLVAVDPVNLVPEAEKKLYDYAEEVILYQDIPSDDEEIIRRIGDADAVLVCYTTTISRHVLEHCPNVVYVGMCCSLYQEESANVDIAYARTRGITVLGIRDYGDRGVVEYALHELIGFLHGYDGRAPWKGLPYEITDLKVGIVGLGVSGGMVAAALQFMGARVSYYSRSRKPEYEERGIAYQPLLELLRENEVVFTCLNKNVLLLGPKEFEALGENKALFNTSIGPAFRPEDLRAWLQKPGTYFFCDTSGAIGDPSGEIEAFANVTCRGVSAGRTKQCFDLLSQKVLANIETFLL